jgi:hypothetical protein
VEKIAWLVLLAVILVAAPLAYRSRRALQVGRVTLGLWYLAAGALVHIAYLVSGMSYATFADAAHLPFVRDTWRSVVAPHQVGWITLLILFEATVGVLVLAGGRRAQVGMVGILGMQAALLLFGWLHTILGGLMVISVGLLVRAERHWDRSGAARPRVGGPAHARG